MIDTQVEKYEKMLIACVLQDPHMRDVLDGKVGTDHAGKETYDFKHPRYDALFQAAMVIAKASGDPTDPKIMKVILEAFARSGRLIEDPAVSEALLDMEEAMAINAESVGKLVHLGLEHWFFKGRIEAAENHKAQSGFDPTAYLERVADAKEKGQSMNAGSVGPSQEIYQIGETIGMEEYMIRRVPMSSHGTEQIAAALGGGLGRKEGALFIAPSGGGKTVVACQMAVDMCISTPGTRGLLVTTEQHPSQLDPRIMSNRCEIPFQQIRDGIRMEDFDSHTQRRIRDVGEELKNTLGVVDWSNGGKSITMDLEDVILRQLEKWGSLDFLVLDWIGGALTEGSAPDELRHIYTGGADYMEYLASKYDIATITMAQAAFGTPNTKKRIGGQDLAESKSMTRNMSVVMGLSALPEMPDEDGEPDPTGVEMAIQEEQYLTISKARRSGPSCIRVRRHYKYQRLGAWSDRGARGVGPRVPPTEELPPPPPAPETQGRAPIAQ